MRDMRALLLVAVSTFSLAACGQGPQDSSEPDKPDTLADEKAQLAPSGDSTGIPAKAGAPFTVNYTVIGTPIVGSPVSLDLQIFSAFGDAPIEIGYQVTDSTAVELPDAQPRSMTIAPAASESSISNRVTVIPLREGRVYINVSAAVETKDGRSSTVISIPLHVGEVDTGLVEHGSLEINEEGETTRVLTSE